MNEKSKKEQENKIAKRELIDTIRRNIRQIRRSRGMTINEFAELLEFSPSHINFIENGERGATTETLYKLKNIMQMPIDFFFCDNTSDADSDLSDDEKIILAKKEKLKCLMYNSTEGDVDFICSLIESYRAFTRQDRE